MINIKNKLESDDFIIHSGMNYTSFALVRTAGEAYHYLFCFHRCEIRTPFSIRFKGTGMQPFMPNLSTQEAYDYCLEHFDSDTTPLGIYEATESYDAYRCFNCEIRINNDCTVDAHYCKSNLKMRDALKSTNAIHVVGADMDYKPLRWAIDYLCKYNIIGPVVELTKFRKKVGIHNDYIVCWEVRNF